MGRLFWKFFIAIWAAQLVGTMSVMFLVETVNRIDPGGRPGAAAESAWTSPTGPVAAALRNDGAGALQQDAAGMSRTSLPDGHPYPLPVRVQVQVQERNDVAPLPPHGAKLLPIEPLLAHLVASLIVAALLAHYLSKPIRSLRTAIRAMASGQLHVAVDNDVKQRKDELADLLREFEHMSARVGTLMAGQRQLFHDVSHELRSPLSRMQVAIGLARQQPERSEELMDRMDGEIVRTDRLIGELLALSRLAAAEIRITGEEFGIDDILAEIVENARFEGQAKGQTIRFPADTGANIKGSPELMRRAIENVVRNAIAHTPDDSRIAVEADIVPARGMLRIAVSDTGPGVPDTEIGVIFDAFFRGAGLDRNGMSHGLGLSITKRIVDAHHGEVRAYNLPERGLCVEISLPVSPPAPE
jgi:two-component system, OmpR family, sensor kinase